MLLAELRDRTHVLIEFKRPSHRITRDDEAQAMKYRDDLSSKFSAIKVLMVGKGRAENSNPTYLVDKLEVLSWDGVVASARNEVGWLLETLARP